jgi:hypothetical protein
LQLKSAELKPLLVRSGWHIPTNGLAELRKEIGEISEKMGKYI